MGLSIDNGVNKNADLSSCQRDSANQVCKFIVIFQIRHESDACLTVHNAFSAQKANRTATANAEHCRDSKETATTAAYQVGNEIMSFCMSSTSRAQR